MTLLSGCAASAVAPRSSGESLIDRAIAARGGPLESLDREVSAKVFQQLPGEWSWEMAYRYPYSFRWTLHTYAEDQIISFDGQVAKLRLGRMPVPAGGQGQDDARSQARWLAITSLDVLARSEGVTWQEIPRAELAAGCAAGARARFPDVQESYELCFDERDRLVAASGPVALPPLGSGHFEARFSDFRSTDGYELAYATTYELNGQLLLEERVQRYTPNDPKLTPESFR